MRTCNKDNVIYFFRVFTQSQIHIKPYKAYKSHTADARYEMFNNSINFQYPSIDNKHRSRESSLEMLHVEGGDEFNAKFRT